MASPQIVDLDTLCKPITEDRPEGVDLRTDRSPSSPYSALKDARNSARAAERTNMFDADSGSETLALWKPIAEQAPKIIAEKSKDLEVASWYIEALIRLKGFAGLRDGFALARVMVSKFWENLYPHPDEDGLETKVGPLTGLNGDGGEGTLLMPIRNSLITTEGSHGAFSYWQYQQARDAAKIADEKQRAERVDTLGFSLDTIHTTVAMGSEQFYVDLIDDIQTALNEFRALNDLLREHCGHQAPPSSNIGNLLDDTLRAVRFLTKDKLAHLNSQPAVEEPTAEANTPAASGAAQAPASGGGSGPIGNREEALRRLLEVANYFRLHEPHTPLAASIDRVIKWGRMPVSQLMMELVPDGKARSIFTQLTGVVLDGSATDSYTPPPVAAPAAESVDKSETNESEAAAPAPVKSDGLTF